MLRIRELHDRPDHFVCWLNMKQSSILNQKVFEHFKWDLMDNPGRDTGDSRAESNLNYESPAQEVSGRTKISKCPRDCSCAFLKEKGSAAFRSCSENQTVAKLKSFGVYVIDRRDFKEDL